MDSIYFGITVAIFFIPTIVANARGKRNTAAIGLLNFFLGWTLIGWIIALVWACTGEDKEKRSAAEVAAI
ncbi:superinfection immunity protein [Phytohalomonas tamaricis]|uniref:superinfection immunity protein n=1 Tax=Phytohalomonas tamaricis TaxID=2081032 RepID=UPI000D0B01CB|nr:superinfection immunity protein [Phytohalomonas tamaricis]